LAFLNTPSLGITPSKSLKERFRYFNAPNRTRNFGIPPERLLLDKSNALRPLNELKDDGIGPSNKLPSKNNFSRLTQLPRFSGSKPDNLFSETSNVPRFFSFSTSTESSLVKSFDDKFSIMDKDGSPKKVQVTFSPMSQIILA
ncbi:hypothetical protein ES319_A10G239000v1, partial [Gossypium barbadense]